MTSRALSSACCFWRRSPPPIPPLPPTSRVRFPVRGNSLALLPLRTTSFLSPFKAQGLNPLLCFKNEDEGLSCNQSNLHFVENTPIEKLDDSDPSFESEDLSCNCNNLHFGESAPPEKLDNNELCFSGINKKNWFLTARKHVHDFFQTYNEPWVVPWKAETVIQVMLLWIASFWFVGSWVIPFLAHTAGFRKEVLTHRGQALYSLLTDMAEGLAGIAILHRCLARFRPLPSGWFVFRWKGNWLIDVLMGCLMFPLVTSLSQLNIDLVPMLPASPVGISSVEQSIVARDPVAMALYAIVVSVCAPVWEEIVFRGFLLPSLTRYMPLWSSILVSAVAFALAHFNVQRMLPLVFLGVVMGAIFARSRNLFASMLLHSLWNGFVFLELMK